MPTERRHPGEAMFVTTKEGGHWIAFKSNESWRGHGIVIHSIKFEDGSVWDAINGWRDERWP